MASSARPWWRVVRAVVLLALLAVAGIVLARQRDEIAGAGDTLRHLRWGWVGVAAAGETASYVAFGAIEGRFLRAGGRPVGLVALTGLSFAGTALANSLPGGTAVSTVYFFRKLRQRGVDDTLATWTAVITTIVSTAVLIVIAATGLAIAGQQGSQLNLGAVVVGLLGITIVGGLVLRRRTHQLRRPALALVGLSRRMLSRPVEEPTAFVDRVSARLRELSPSRTDWFAAAALALANWAADCTCLAAAFLAVGAPVPWRALLLAYGAGQLAAALPITPGGLGVVEGSLTIALVTYGGATVPTVAAVLLYRLISFWAILPVGYAIAGIFILQQRRQSGGAPAAGALGDESRAAPAAAVSP